MEIIIVILIVVLIIVYSARKNFMDNNSYNTDHTYNGNSRVNTSSFNSNTNNDKLNRLKTLSDRLVLKSQEMANSLSEYGLTPKNNSMMIDVANDWETITDLYLEVGDKANSLYIMMGGQRQPFPTFMLCMQGFLTEVQQAIEEEMKK